MKSNKEIKNISTDEESIKRGLKDIKEGRTFNEVQIRAISELLKIKDKEYSQKLKELEHEIDRLKSSKRWYSKEQIGEFHTQINKQSEEINQLKSQLKDQAKQIFDDLGKCRVFRSDMFICNVTDLIDVIELKKKWIKEG